MTTAAHETVTLEPAIKADEWYWARDVAKAFKFARDAMSQMKKMQPHLVVRCRRGDLIFGQLVLDYLASRRNSRAAV